MAQALPSDCARARFQKTAMGLVFKMLMLLAQFQLASAGIRTYGVCMGGCTTACYAGGTMAVGAVAVGTGGAGAAAAAGASTFNSAACTGMCHSVCNFVGYQMRK